MAVLLVAIFPILLLINSPVALLAVLLGIVLLYLDNRERGVAGAARSRVAAGDPRPRVGRLRAPRRSVRNA